MEELPLWVQLLLVFMGILVALIAAGLLVFAIAGLFRLYEIAVDAKRNWSGKPLDNWWNYRQGNNS